MQWCPWSKSMQPWETHTRSPWLWIPVQQTLPTIMQIIRNNTKPIVKRDGEHNPFLKPSQKCLSCQAESGSVLSTATHFTLTPLLWHILFWLARHASVQNSSNQTANDNCHPKGFYIFSFLPYIHLSIFVIDAENQLHTFVISGDSYEDKLEFLFWKTSWI